MLVVACYSSRMKWRDNAISPDISLAKKMSSCKSCGKAEEGIFILSMPTAEKSFQIIKMEPAKLDSGLRAESSELCLQHSPTFPSAQDHNSI